MLAGKLKTQDGGGLAIAGPTPMARRTTKAVDAAEAFGDLYRSALPEVYRYLSARCRSEALAEDLTQDTFVSAARAIRRGGVEVSLPWLVTIARNKLIDHIRREEVSARAGRRLGGASVPDELIEWQGEASRDQALAALYRLPSSQRAVLMLRYLDGLPVGEIAPILEKSVHAVESLLARGREAFKRHYVEAFDV